MAKVARLEKQYTRIGADGKPTKERDGVPTGEFKFGFKETGNELAGSVFQIPGMTSEIWASLPPVVKNLVMHGIMQKCGDPAAGETGEDVEEAVTGLVEMVLAGNFYAERVKGEARPSLVAEAVWTFKKQSGGLTSEGKAKRRLPDGTIVEETKAELFARYAGENGAELRKAATGDSRIKVILENIKLERQKERAALAAKKAAETGAKPGVEADTL